MIVIDASAVVDLLISGPGTPAVAARLRKARSCAAPHLLDAEVGQVIRRMEHAGTITLAEAQTAFVDLAALPITRYAHGTFLPHAFDLRANATMFDALYLVLAEALGIPLVTRDQALRSIPGHRARVEVI